MQQYIIVAIFVILATIGIYFFTKKETFEPTYVGTADYVTTSDANIQDPNVLSHGYVQKYEQNGTFYYELFFNLPEASSVFQTSDVNKPFNETTKQSKYNVAMGTSDKYLKYVGDLERRGDGIHYLKVNTDKNYTQACVSLDNVLVNCLTI
jgi:hypothetical protein